MSYLSSAHITEGQPPNPFGSSFACSLVYPLPLESSGRRGWCRIADSVFFQPAPNLGRVVLKAWSA
jgi:hypothetical protein